MRVICSPVSLAMRHESSVGQGSANCAILVSVEGAAGLAGGTALDFDLLVPVREDVP